MRDISFSLAVFVLYKIKDLCFALVLTDLRIPWQVVANNDVVLECQYDMNNMELYTFKWYKDGHEFYRYMPRSKPTKQMFLLPDVTVDLKKSSNTQVVLSNVSLASAGRYACEISAEAPAFVTVSGVGDMQVIALPDTSPTITGAKQWYRSGELLHLNCTSGRSKPATILSWYINDERATEDMLRKYDIITDQRQQLESTSLGLQFKVQTKHFHNGEIKLKCLAVLPPHVKAHNGEDVNTNDQTDESVPSTSEPQPHDGLQTRFDASVAHNISKAGPVHCNRLFAFTIQTVLLAQWGMRKLLLLQHN